VDEFVARDRATGPREDHAPTIQDEHAVREVKGELQVLLD
jgi:hypothetical protein